MFPASFLVRSAQRSHDSWPNPEKVTRLFQSTSSSLSKPHLVRPDPSGTQLGSLEACKMMRKMLYEKHCCTLTWGPASTQYLYLSGRLKHRPAQIQATPICRFGWRLEKSPLCRAFPVLLNLSIPACLGFGICKLAKSLPFKTEEKLQWFLAFGNSLRTRSRFFTRPMIVIRKSFSHGPDEALRSSIGPRIL